MAPPLDFWKHFPLIFSFVASLSCFVLFFRLLCLHVFHTSVCTFLPWPSETGHVRNLSMHGLTSTLMQICQTDLDSRGGVVAGWGLGGGVKLWNCSGQQEHPQLPLLPCSSAQEVICTPVVFLFFILPTQMISIHLFCSQICIDLVFIGWCLVLAIKLSWFSLF